MYTRKFCLDSAHYSVLSVIYFWFSGPNLEIATMTKREKKVKRTNVALGTEPAFVADAVRTGRRVVVAVAVGAADEVVLAQIHR